MFENILVSALVNLGDVVLVTSAVALIKKNFPNARVTMMVKRVVGDAVINNPVVDGVIVMDYRSKNNSISTMFATVKDIRRRRFDLYISFDRKLRPALLAWLARIPRRVGPSKVFDDNKSRVTKLYTDVVSIDHDLNRTLQAQTYQTIVRKFFGVDGSAEPVFARVTSESRARVDRLFGRLPAARFRIALCVKGTFELKTYPKEYFAMIVAALRTEFEAVFFVIGAPNDRDYADEVINSIPPTRSQQSPIVNESDGATNNLIPPTRPLFPAGTEPATNNQPTAVIANHNQPHTGANNQPNAAARPQQSPTVKEIDGATNNFFPPTHPLFPAGTEHAAGDADTHPPKITSLSITERSKAPAFMGRAGGEKKYDPVIENFCGETTLIDLVEIFRRTDLFVTVDTGATHIAATTGVKMVTMYGCTPPARWHPINPNAIALSSNEPCCPCSVKPNQCPSYPKPNCLYHVKPQQVLDACRKLLGGVHNAQ